MDVLLERVDKSKNMFRFYRVETQPNLFGDHSVVVQWGRIGSQGRVRVNASGSQPFVEKIAARLVNLKIKRGYVPFLEYSA